MGPTYNIKIFVFCRSIVQSKFLPYVFKKEWGYSLGIITSIFFPFWSITEVGHLHAKRGGEKFSLCSQLIRKRIALTYSFLNKSWWHANIEKVYFFVYEYDHLFFILFKLSKNFSCGISNSSLVLFHLHGRLCLEN